MIKTVSFYGTCLARSEKTLVTPMISRKFTIKKVSARFPSGSNNLIKLYFFYSIDDDAPAAGRPSGTSILQDYGQVEYIVGNNDSKIMNHNVEVKNGNMYLKVYAYNEDYYDHDIDVQMEIEI